MGVGTGVDVGVGVVFWWLLFVFPLVVQWPVEDHFYDKFIGFCKNITIYDQTAAAISGQSFSPHHLQTGYAV